MESPTHFPHAHATRRAIDLAGGQSALARICGVGQSAVWKWLNVAGEIPAEHILKVEAATGVSRHDLRPDLYPREESAPRPAGSLVPVGRTGTVSYPEGGANGGGASIASGFVAHAPATGSCGRRVILQDTPAPKYDALLGEPAR